MSGIKRINPRKATIPLCKKCNSDFGRILEAPMKEILLRVENGEGIADKDADIIVRWMWKTTGLIWHLNTPNWFYSGNLSLAEKVLHPITDEYRAETTLALARIKSLESEFHDEPMGFDVLPKWSGILASGVFGKVAIIVTMSDCDSLVPDNFTLYKFLTEKQRSSERLFFPKTGFENSVDAVGITKEVSRRLEAAHNFLLALFNPKLKSLMAIH